MSTGAPSTDLLQIDDQLTDEERLIRDSVRAFVGDRALPHITDWFEAGLLPRDIMPELGKLGVLGMHLTGYGCAGTGAIAYGVACRELEACDSGLRSAASVQGSLSMYPIWRYGSEEQKTEWLPRMAAGEAIGCFGLTEPDHGSDPGRHADRRPPGRIGLGALRYQDVDHQRQHRRYRRDLGRHPGRHPRVPRPARHAWLHCPRHPQEAFAARLHHIRTAPGRGPPACRGRASRRQRARRAPCPA